MSDQYELDSLQGLIAAIKKYHADMDMAATIDGLYCPKCGDFRRMMVSMIFAPETSTHVKLNALDLATNASVLAKVLSPSLFEYQCVQCDTEFTALIYEGPDGPALAVMPNTKGGVVTPNTPDGVAYYLDQADRSKAVGAYSAAIAMFRSALEQLLFDQGYKKGVLNEKIQTLVADISSGTGPKWALDLEDEFLIVIKDLGNTSVHPNGGDIKIQEKFDSELISKVVGTFSGLLFIIYEAPHKKAILLADLKKAGAVKKQTPKVP